MFRHEFPAWTAAFSERIDGDLRVSARTAAEPLAEVQARTLGTLDVAAIVVGRQVHGTDVLIVEEDVEGYAVGLGEADAVATARRGVASAVHVGDCLPIAVGGAGAVAMVHAGWRGLAGGIVAAGVSALRDLGANGELQAMIGPGAGGCCYETGDEVREIFAAYDASRGRLLDLELVAARQLRDAGVENILCLHRCTICDERYFSHRRDGGATGRHGGFAWLR
jgi:YfiH family protein